jgi:hypothetical protein
VQGSKSLGPTKFLKNWDIYKYKTISLVFKEWLCVIGNSKFSSFTIVKSLNCVILLVNTNYFLTITSSKSERSMAKKVNKRISFV